MATSALASDLSAATQAKIVDNGNGWAQAFAAPEARVPIIVDFRMPAVPDRAAFASDDDMDAAHIAAVRSVQDRILSGILGGGAGIEAAQSSSETNLKLMPFSPQFAMHATAAQMEAIASDPQVVRIHEDRIDHPLLNRNSTGGVGSGSLDILQMPNAYSLGAAGNGWRVAVLDTGGRRSHEFLSNSISHAACFSTTATGQYQSYSLCPGGAATSTTIDSANDCDAATISGCGHGTHVAGTAAGFNTSPSSGEPGNGVARDAKVLSVGLFSRFSVSTCQSLGASYRSNGCVLTYTSDQISALNYVNAQRNTLKIASINMSLGGGYYTSACNDDSRRAIIQTLRNNNVATVIAAGNDYYDAAVSAPGCIPEAVTVGSATKVGARSAFSNWGSLIDVVAPGSSIYASYLNGSSNTFYDFLSGTSMATPHVAGAFAAIRSRLPNATVTQIENALKATGVGVTSAGYTKPNIRVSSALNNLGVTTPPITTTSIVAAVTPVARRGVKNSQLTAFAALINTGSTTATSCSIAKPAGGQPYTFAYAERIISGNTTTLGPTNTPINIPAGATRHFLMTYVPTAAMSANLQMVFDCTNSSPAPTYLGLNSFNLVATDTAGPDLIAIAATPTGDGILRVPTNGSVAAAMAAVNIGTAATVRARLSTTPMGGSTVTLPLTLGLCRTNTAGACVQPTVPTTGSIDFSAAANGVATFSAFIKHSGAAIPFDPAARRLYIHFEQSSGGSWIPVGSASVAVTTAAADANMAALPD